VPKVRDARPGQVVSDAESKLHHAAAVAESSYMMPLQPMKPSPRSDELAKLRRELLRRIVESESRRQDPRRSGAK
jgi:hypothetical protein